MKHIKQSQQFDISIIYIAMDDAVFIMLLPEGKFNNDGKIPIVHIQFRFKMIPFI
ncbi:hypothetical protein K5E_11090 [Enterococcus thailandicus]|nr:hypothetical protein K4E_01030 [Enterococcus thailandicus]GMC08970.1 hypothetical protein K5E_11090 [Enterococcus thailandicus]